MLIDKMDPLILPLLALKKRGAFANGRLWSFEPGTLTTVMKESAAALGLEGFGFSAYSLHHGGASHDLLCGQRVLAGVKRRGR